MRSPWRGCGDAGWVRWSRRRVAAPLALLLAAGLLNACTALKSAPDAPVTGRAAADRRVEFGPLPADDNQAVAVLLAYVQRLRSLNYEDMRREYVAANQAYARSRADEQRLRLGLVLVAPNAAVRDDARAAGLFESALAERGRAGGLGQFVNLLQGMLAERGRQVREEQRRTDALQQKLDALKAIEQSMSERDTRNGAARGREQTR